MISQRERGELARFYTVTDPKKHQKGYTVYKVTARIISRKSPEDVQEITVWKRYSDFRKLHQNLWQLHKNLCSQSELFPPFAKAKVFGRFDDSVIEERRQCSEDLLQFSANIPALYSSQHIEDFFKGGEVHDGSELIGPAESFSDFLADSLSDCSSEVQRDFSGADDITVTSEYGGPSSDSDLTSLAVDTDSLAGLDDHGMASGRTSPNQPPGGSPLLPSLHRRPSPAASPSPVPRVPPPAGSSTPNPDVSLTRSGRSSSSTTTALNFSSSLKRVVAGKDPKPDYLDRASEHIRLAVQKEAELDYQSAFSYYRSGVDLLLQGVQGEPSPTRREAVKKRTAEYLMRAEQISTQHLRSNMGQGSTQTVTMGAQCCPPSSRGDQQSPADELRAYRVLGVIDKVLLVMDKRTQETFILKGLRKSSDCGKPKRTIMPHTVPNMVQLKKFVVSEDTVFLLLQYAEGGKLWSHIGKFLRSYSPDESFDIPFIQKSHTTAIRSPQHAAVAQPGGRQEGSAGSGAGSTTSSGPGGAAQLLAFPGGRKKGLLAPGLAGSLGAQSDSGGATSEEECTNSYLTLCNEYEQEKVEPDALEGEATAAAAQGEEGEEKSGGGLDAPAVAAATSSSSRTRSLLSNDSLSSPLSSQELCFFTESSDNGGGSRYPGNGQDCNSEVFSPLPSPPAAPLLSLDQSKRTPMEFFRIDSKDSASEVICPDAGPPPKTLFNAPSSSDHPGSEVTASEEEEELPELAQEAKSHMGGVSAPPPWGLDPSGGEEDKVSNESVAVISFQQAAVEDEGQPPDLLVNLPLVTDGVVDDSLEDLGDVTGVCLGLEVTASPQKKKASTMQPDVLQLHSQQQQHEDEEEEERSQRDVPKLRAASAPCQTGRKPSSSSTTSPSCVWVNYSLAFGREEEADGECQNKDQPLPDDAISIPPPPSSIVPVTDSLGENPELGRSLLNTDLGPDQVNVDSHREGDACTTGMERILCLDAKLCRDNNSNGDTNGSEYDKEVSRLFAELDRLSLAASQARIPEEFVRSWAVEMVLALDALHQEGIVCRDLNPNNILLNHQGHVQLTYFCSWSDVEESYDQDAIANMYCAPEVGGISEETTACDWWSLGAILFELLTGKSLLQCHPAGISRHTALNIPECVSEEAGSLLEQLLQYNPVERLGSGVAGVDDIKSHPFFSRVEWLK